MPKILNCRSTALFVTDGANASPMLGEAYPHTYSNGLVAGVVSGTTITRDRDNTLDPQLAGVLGHANDGTQLTVRADLPSGAGQYPIGFGLGDTAFEAYEYLQILDGSGSALLTIDKSAGNNPGARWYDSTGTLYTAANWVANQVPTNLLFTQSFLTVVIGSPTAQTNASTIATLFIGDIISSATPQRGCLTMIADRMVKAVMVASAVHTVVGSHVLRGAAQRTKVALPVVTRAKVTPPPVRSDTLAYRLQGAPQRKPRLLPTTALTRKPLPVTKSVQLPHMLKGAPQRKNWPFPEVSSAQIQKPIAKTFVGKKVFANAVVVPAILQTPTIAEARTPLPMVRSFVLRAVLQRPTAGSGAPVLSMIEMDPPVTRSFVAHRTQLQPVPPAPSRPDPTVVLVRTPRPVTDSWVGEPLPRSIPPAPRRPRPMVALARLPLPKTQSFDGPQSRWFIASHERWTKPIIALTRTPLPRMHQYAGSGVERGPAIQMTLAIAFSSGTVSLGTEQYLTIPLTTSE